MSDEAYDFWVTQIGTLYDSAVWKEVMAANGIAPLDLRGPEFEAFVGESVAGITEISKQIGIIQ
jgi:putative tricarboxylic transport membrane protein